MSTDPQRPRLDAAALERLQELDPDGRQGVVRRVLEAYETSLQRMLLQLAAERHSGNPQTVSNIAHTLKSSSASVGALALSTVCHEVERRRRGGDAVGLDGDVAQIVAEGEAALAAVRAMLRP
jgi:HPt (histidine-containing phosphotransfer) domain-containing protein